MSKKPDTPGPIAAPIAPGLRLQHWTLTREATRSLVSVGMSIDIEVGRRRFTLEEYRRMGEVGILHEDDRVELIHGEIIEMSPIGSRHAACVAVLTELLVRGVGDRAILWPQNPLTILPDSEPQPDIVLLARRPDFYREAIPQAGDVLLVIEVAESSIRYDRRVKRGLYAGAGVPEYWIVDLEGQRIEVYRSPAGEDYREAERRERGARVAPLAFPDVTLPVATIIG